MFQLLTLIHEAKVSEMDMLNDGLSCAWTAERYRTYLNMFVKHHVLKLYINILFIIS